MTQSYALTSHESFSHDSIDSLGYDWERIANPRIAPKVPFKVYLPLTTEDIVRAVREIRQLGQKLTIRSKGHSSNDLVLADRGHVLCTEKLGRILDLNVSEGTVTVQAGVALAALDAYLGERGLGLPIIGDHSDITAAGFASVGGISPASHRYGLFIDNVSRVEYVTLDGEVRTCGRDDRPGDLYRVLAGLGQHGIISSLTLDVIRIDKYQHILRNDRALFSNVNDFVRESQRRIEEPGEARMERGLWLDYPVLGRDLLVGQFSSYYDTPRGPLKSLRNRFEYGYLHGLGRWAGRLPAMIDGAVKLAGMAGILMSPRYASIKNVEMFSDRILDSSVGDPTRMFIVLAPVGCFSTLFHRIHALFLEYRKRAGCFTFISIYVKAIRSPYLAVGNDGRYSELMVYCGIKPEQMTVEVTDSLVSRLDDLCIQEGALRYMHSKTVRDPERRRKIDPNAVRARVEGAGTTRSQPPVSSNAVAPEASRVRGKEIADVVPPPGH